MQLKSKFLERYHLAHRTSRVHIYKRPWLVPIVGLFVAVGVVGVVTLLRGHTPELVDSHIVYVFDGGKRQTLDTKAATVGELVKRLPLNLIPQDVVEPAADTRIVQDNFRVNVYRARPVTVVDNGTKIVAVTAQKSARVAAQDAGLTVYPEDKASFIQGSIETNTIGEEVVIDRATPVNFVLYGTPLTVRTHAKTVADLLKEKNVTLTKDDTLTPALETPLAPDIQVNLVRNGTQVVTIQEDIPAPVQYISDANLSLGATAVRQAGSPGKKAVTYQIVTENGKETSRVVLQSTIVQDAVPQIIAQGTIVFVNGDHSSLMAAAGISSGDYGYVDYIVGNESGWCYTKWQGEYGGCPAYHGTPSSSYVGYGLCQATPGYKMATAGADWGSNPITQLRWCSSYATRTYGGWYGAYSHWRYSHNW
jgi:uncharacterized protein YabE (DUF348 family)